MWPPKQTKKERKTNRLPPSVTKFSIGPPGRPFREGLSWVSSESLGVSVKQMFTERALSMLEGQINNSRESKEQQGYRMVTVAAEVGQRRLS